MEAPVLGSSPRMDLYQGESGSGASLGATIAKSDRTFRRPAMVRCSEAFDGFPSKLVRWDPVVC